jgi:anti-anti-sigma factor
MIEVALTPSMTTLVIDGDLDVAERDGFPEVRARVAGLRHGRLVVDMCGVTFMDSTGAAFLISLADESMARGSETVLRGPSDRDLFVLEICGVLDMFVIQRECDDHGHTSGVAHPTTSG